MKFIHDFCNKTQFKAEFSKSSKPRCHYTVCLFYPFFVFAVFNLKTEQKYLTSIEMGQIRKIICNVATLNLKS